MSTERHEASHAAVAVYLRRRVEYVERYSGSFLPGEALGFCFCPIDEAIEATQVPLALIGYMSEGRKGWPPPYEQARDEPREGLGKLIHLLDISEEQYRKFITITRDIFVDPHFIRLRDAIEQALYSVPRLDAIAVLDLAKATGVLVSPDPIGAP
jgi:hypothetical protein